MSTVAVFYEGVLINSEDQPILDGFLLVHSLATGNRVVVLTEGTRARVEHQLRTERLLDQIAQIVDKSVDLPPLDLWKRQLETARSEYPIHTVLTSRPEIAEYVVEHGMVSLFFAHPGFSRPAQRPEQGNRSWDDLVGELASRFEGRR